MSLQTQLTSDENINKCNTYRTLKNKARKLEEYTAKKLLALNDYCGHISLIPSANEVALLQYITKIISQRCQLIKALVRVKTYEEDVVQSEVTEFRISQIQRLKNVLVRDISDFNLFKNTITNERKQFRVSFLNNSVAASISGDKKRGEIEKDSLGNQVNSFLSRNYFRAGSPSPTISADNSPYLANTCHNQYYKSQISSFTKFSNPSFSYPSPTPSILSFSSLSSSSSTAPTAGLEVIAIPSTESLNPFSRNHNIPQNYYIDVPSEDMSIISEEARKKHEVEKQQLAFGMCESQPKWQKSLNGNAKYSIYKNTKKNNIGQLVFWQKPSTIFLIGFIFVFMAMLSIFASLFLSVK